MSAEGPVSNPQPAATPSGLAGPPRIAAVLFDHGSRAPGPRRTLGEAMGHLRERIGGQADVLLRASMEEIESWHWLPHKLREAVEDHGAQVVIGVPFFLSMGRHMGEDNPRTFAEIQAEYPPAVFELARPLLAEPDVTDVLVARVREACSGQPLDPARSVVILAAHGNRDPAGVAFRQPIVERFERELAGQAAAVREAVLKFEGDRLLELRLDEAGRRGWNDALVVPVLLGPGRYTEEFIPQVAAAARQRHPALQVRMARPIGGGPDVADVLARRFAEARARALARWQALRSGRGDCD